MQVISYPTIEAFQADAVAMFQKGWVLHNFILIGAGIQPHTRIKAEGTKHFAVGVRSSRSDRRSRSECNHTRRGYFCLAMAA
jgi:hypothetical protein